MAAHSRLSLDVRGVSKANGANVYQYTYFGNNNQKVVFKKLPNGTHLIVFKHSGKCLDVKGFSKKNGGNVHQVS